MSLGLESGTAADKQRTADCGLVAELPVADARWPIPDDRFPKLQTHNWVVLGNL